jgi:phospholipid-binding lipoprotein MlaA
MPWANRICAVLALALCGCATPGGNPADPLEPFNRAMFSFNDSVDRAVLKPVAQGYRSVVPDLVRTGVSNFFSNLEDAWICVNNLLQGKFEDGGEDLGRFVFNSTFGLAGIFDFATDAGFQKHNEDFGQTLGRWGVADGPYLVLPLLGPSNFRDTVGWAGDYFTDPEFYLVSQSPETWIVFGTRVINVRTNLLETERIFDAAAIDKYAFLRDAYLQRRRSMIYDGNPPSSGTEHSDAPRRKTLKEMEQELDAEEPAQK